MLTDYDEGELQHKWTKIVTKFGVEDQPWANDIDEKRKMCDVPTRISLQVVTS